MTDRRIGYVLALSLGIATALRELSGRIFGPTESCQIFLVPVMLSALWTGPFGGLIAALTSAFICTVNFFPMAYSPAPLNTRIGSLILFAAESITIILIVARQSRSRDRLACGLKDATDDKEKLASVYDELLKIHKELGVQVDAKNLELSEALKQLKTEICRRKQAEEDLRIAKEQAEGASVAKSEFLANVSHEIRTPLGAVVGFAELLTNQSITPSDRFDFVGAMKRNAELLTSVVNDILDLSKIEAGKIEIERVDTPLSEIISDVDALLALKAGDKGLKFSITGEGVLPTRIVTDPRRLKQILVNLIGNAIKFTSQGEVVVEVKMQKHDQGPEHLAFYIKDTGLGIPPDRVPKLFEPFSQADASITRRFGGTGLGLNLSRRFARALGGDVVLAKTVLDCGSTFVVTIDAGTPCKFDLVPSHALWQRSGNFRVESHETNSMRVDGCRVLVVDDSPDNRLLMERILKSAGANVETASDGKQGVEKAIGRDFDVILMDLQMPEMDGFQALSVLKKMGYEKPIVALTAHAMKQERERCLELGFKDHLAKPVDRKSLFSCLHNLVGATFPPGRHSGALIPSEVVLRA